MCENILRATPLAEHHALPSYSPFGMKKAFNSDLRRLQTPYTIVSNLWWEQNDILTTHDFIEILFCSLNLHSFHVNQDCILYDTYAENVKLKSFHNISLQEDIFK